MKKIMFAACLLISAIIASGQTDTIQHPYLKFPTYPPVKLLLPDSTSFYTKQDLPKKLPVMVMVFNPQCDHCQHETEELIRNMDKLKNVQIVMATSSPFADMKGFIEKYKLGQYSNIVVAQDTHFFLLSFYMLHNLPFHAFYNKKKELISAFEGSMTMEKILGVLFPGK